MPQPLYIDDLTVDKAVKLWKDGQVVAMPTETVYGLAADATNGAAVAKIYALKSRPQFNPLIVHVADVATAKRYVEWNIAADILAKQFWPGPLTLVLKRRTDCTISELVSAGGDTLAMRVPSHPVALALLKAFDRGIAAPSANRSGRVSPTTAEHVRAEFGDALPLIIDGGACVVGIESTVVDVTTTFSPKILRPGSVTREKITQILQSYRTHPHPIRVADNNISHTGQEPMTSPGQLASHYAPSIPVRMNATHVTADEALLAFGNAPLAGAATTLNLSPRGDLIEAAANLFAMLRQLDQPTHRAIAVMPISNEGIGEAINDRLTRASVAT